MVMKPDIQVVAQLPIQIFSGWDRLGDILSVLNQHDFGIFRSSAMLCDGMMRDDRIKTVTSTRISALIAAGVEHKPADSKRKAARVAEALGGSADRTGVWDLIVPPDVVRGLCKWKFMMGFCLAELVWTTLPGMHVPGTNFPMWIPRLKVWHPQFVYFDWASFSYMLITGNGVIRLPRVDENVYSDGKWFLYCPDGYHYGWLEALVRALSVPYAQRGWVNRDWSRHSEIQGTAIVKAFVPEAAEDDAKDEFFNDVANRGAELAVMVPVGEGGRDKGYDVVYEEAKARTWECFKDLKSAKDIDIAVLVNGQNLSTESGGDGIGGGHAANMMNQVRFDVRKSDGALISAIKDQVISWWTLYNFGDRDLTPRSTAMVDPPEDELAEGNSLKAIGDGIKSVKDASDYVDERALLDQHGIPMKTDEEMAAERAVADERRQAMISAMQQPRPAKSPFAENDKGVDAGDKSEPQDEGKLSSPTGRALALHEAFGLALPEGKRAERIARASASGHPTPGPVKRFKFQELPIAIENVAGSTRFWYEAGAATPHGSTKMQHDYGYIEGHRGKDGEDVDVYVGPNAEAANVYVVHQLREPAYTHYDEDKVMLGFDSHEEAKAAYAAHRNDGEQAIQAITTMSVGRFKKKLSKRTGSGKIHATALTAPAGARYASSVTAADLEATTTSLMRLAARATDKAAYGRKRTVAGSKRAERYADRLTDKSKRLAVTALAVDLARIKGEIEKCSSFEDLKTRIKRAFRDEMDPSRLAQIVKKANIMAHLYGRLEAVDRL